MRDKIAQAFDQVQAEEALKTSTREYIRRKTRGYTRTRQIPRYLRLVPVAACLVLAVLAGNWLYFTPTVEISIDINPSIELGVNRFDRVVTATGYNADGQALLDTLEVQNLDYNDAVEQIINSDTVAALLSGDGIVTIGVIGPDGEQTARVLSDMEACTSRSENMHCYHADGDTAEEAHEMGLSCGKYRAYQQLLQVDPAVTPEQVANMTMREIWDRIQALSGTTAETAPAQSEYDDGTESHTAEKSTEQGHHGGEHGEQGYRHGGDED